MKFCDKCHVFIRGHSKQCPLCNEVLEADKEQGNHDEPEGYPYIQEKWAKNRFLFWLCLILSAVGSCVCILINLTASSRVLWSLIVVTALLLLWETVGFMILSKKNIGWRLFAQMLAVMLVLITIDAVTGWRAWSIAYIAPFVTVASSFVMTVIFYINRTKWREYILFQMIIATNGFIPVILFWCGLTSIIWPAAAGALYSLVTFTGMLIFADKQMKNELTKRFHL